MRARATRARAMRAPPRETLATHSYKDESEEEEEEEEEEDDEGDGKDRSESAQDAPQTPRRDRGIRFRSAYDRRDRRIHDRRD